MSGRRIELSATQVAASVLASVSGAIAASYLGVAGTIIGAAVLSFVSTAGTAIYLHYLTQTREKIRTVAPRPLNRAGNGHQDRPTQGHGTAAGRQPRSETADRNLLEGDATVPLGRQRLEGTAARPGTSPGDRPARHLEDTVILPRVNSGTSAESPARGAGAASSAGTGNTERTGSEGHPGHSRTRLDGQGWQTGQEGQDGQPGQGGRDGRGGRLDQGGRPDQGGRAGRGRRLGHIGQRGRRRILVVAGATLVAFLVSMGGITAFEAATGRPLDSSVWHRHDSGTTIGDIITGNTGHSHSHATDRKPTAKPATKPSTKPAVKPTSKATSEPAPTRGSTPTSSVPPSPAATPSPSPSATAPTPTPSATAQPTSPTSPAPSVPAAPAPTSPTVTPSP